MAGRPDQDFTVMDSLILAATWAHQAAGGCWRPEPTWIDRAGRLAGLAWLVLVPLVWARYLA